MAPDAVIVQTTLSPNRKGKLVAPMAFSTPMPSIARTSTAMQASAMRSTHESGIVFFLEVTIAKGIRKISRATIIAPSVKMPSSLWR